LKKITYLSALFISSLSQLNAQSNLVSIDGETIDLINRLSTLSGSIPEDLHTTVQPMDAKLVSDFLEQAKRYNTHKAWSRTDNIALSIAASNVGEWAEPDGNGAIASENPIGPFYQKITDLYSYNNRNFFLAINPEIAYQGIFEEHNANNYYAQYFTAGANIRANFKKAVGLQLSLRHVSETPVQFYTTLNHERNTWIGAPRDSRNNLGNNKNYFLPTGNLSTALLKNYVSLRAGYDYLKLGVGYRSLILSDFSSPVGYVTLRTKVWKLQYDNFYLRIDADKDIPSNPLTISQPNYKFATAHQLSINVNKWLNVGMYEMVVFNRSNHFELSYLNPIIFYRAAARALGSPDKVAIGINAKAVAAKGLSIYGQFLLNEFSAKEFFATNGYIHNKWGAQLGFNYYDAFNISNLNLQVEGNCIRPYTFQHIDRGEGFIAANFTNNNLPLGHPLGAGFRELIVKADYHPTARLKLAAKWMMYQKGMDKNGDNYGNDLSKSYAAQIPNGNMYGARMINGATLTRTLYSLHASYRIYPNLYFDLGGMYGSFKYKDLPQATDFNHMQVFSGIRLNLNHKDYSKI
jgi:hypothetical protein